MTAVAGWYDDGSGRSRWWDGMQWSDAFAPVVQVVQPQQVVQVVSRKSYKTSHGFHLLMSIVTLGLWLPVWLIVGIYNASKA